MAPPFEVNNLTMAYGDFVIQTDLTFTIAEGDIFIIMGGSGCGKSTLLRHLVGLKSPAKGEIYFRGEDFWAAPDERRIEVMRQFGVMYQYGALWSSMTISENITLPILEYTDHTEKEAKELASVKLSFVGLKGFEDFYPSEISGGMRKRAALARALALDPQVLFFDEPSAGLDPISAKNLDELILELRDALGATIVVVTHELPSIFAIANNSVFLDPETKTMLGAGDPKELLQHSGDPRIVKFLTRGETEEYRG